MKLAVITLTIGDFFKEMSKITHPYIKAYAEKIGADFIIIDECKISKTTPHWEKFQLLEYLSKYDRVLYIDTDVLIKKDCPNLFDIVPEDKLGAFNEAPFTERRDIAIERISDDYDYKNFQWNGKYYNSGVLVLSKKHRYLFRKPEKEVSNFFEQSYFNLVLIQNNTEMFDLNYKFNRMYCMDQFIGEERFASYIIHYAGFWNRDIAMATILKDKEFIDNITPDYKSKRKIWIQVTGGLGDQIEAEPSIRFMLKKIYPDDDVRVSTHFPEIFAHLPVKCETHDKHIWENCNTQPFTRNSLPSPETFYWRVVSNLLCHTVDYCAMALLARTLPDIDKEIKLTYKAKDLENIHNFTSRNDFSDCVLIHAGKHWESKTFPESWWQEIVDGIIEQGLTPIFIGKDDSTRGVTKLDGRGKSIDLVNLLSLPELFAIISQVPILISNDSAPIHIAGAFNNWIVLIPTCKHPDHILPWRNKSKEYKTSALYKKLTIDDLPSAPTTIEGSVADKVPGKFEDYLPDANDVINEIKKIRGYYEKNGEPGKGI